MEARKHRIHLQMRSTKKECISWDINKKHFISDLHEVANVLMIGAIGSGKNISVKLSPKL